MRLLAMSASEPRGECKNMQDRAARTRALIVDTAAAEFAREGYDGVTYRQIAAAAGVSIGSLTFHFASKSDLADTVLEEGRRAAQQVVQRVAGQGGPALQQVLNIAVELTRLLEQDIRAWGALRLTRDRPQAVSWSGLYLPTVHGLLLQARAAGELRAASPPEDLSVLVEHLVNGAEGYLRDRIAGQPGAEDPSERLHKIWRLVLDGVSPAPLAPSVPPDLPAPRGLQEGDRTAP
ncbi:TetR family transcriptional regulator [Streptomyces sp. NPDC021093]|uniref:TetR family transcriptional regulator n=1 Tax=Streptomyces sp. NPDC021093 TaxID=3365112 RepID=UPI0037AA93F9